MHLINKLKRQYPILFLCFAIVVSEVAAIGEVIWAINAGGDAHTDIHGIRYQRDPHSSGVASDYGKNLIIQREVPQDQILYQTERYDHETFGYDIPIRKDGDYVLVLKFCEVWFTAPNQKVFDVYLNEEHTIVDSLDIYAKVGRGVAHDEIIPFRVKKSELVVTGEKSIVEDAKISVKFIKGERDNPKVNAMYVMRGTVDDVPQLPPMPGLDENINQDVLGEDEEEIEDELKPKKKRPTSGPKVQDPYAADDTSSMMLPVVVAIGCFIPLVFCLCKL